MRHPRDGMRFARVWCHPRRRRVSMRPQVLALAAVLALLAGCNKGPNNQPAPRTETPSQSTAPSTTPGTSTTPSSSATSGQSASEEEKKEAANPTQGQVDPKAGEQ